MANRQSIALLFYILPTDVCVIEVVGCIVGEFHRVAGSEQAHIAADHL